MAKTLRVAPKRPLSGIPADETIQKLIAEAAYYRAEQRGFAPGGEIEDWLHAEAEITARLRESS